jgi:hypothetical protein
LQTPQLARLFPFGLQIRDHRILYFFCVNITFVLNHCTAQWILSRLHLLSFSYFRLLFRVLSFTSLFIALACCGVSHVDADRRKRFLQL